MQPPTRQRGSVSVHLVEKEYITLYKITTDIYTSAQQDFEWFLYQ